MRLLATLIDLYIWIVIIRVIISWLNVDTSNQIVKFLDDITEPILRRIRDVVPLFGGLDLSPLILILVLSIIKRMIY